MPYSFVTCIEKLLNEICLVDVVGNTFNICFLGFNMMTVGRMKIVNIVYHVKHIDNVSESNGFALITF